MKIPMDKNKFEFNSFNINNIARKTNVNTQNIKNYKRFLK